MQVKTALVICGFNGAKGAMRPELGRNKFHERPPGASGMQENLLAAVAPSWTLVWELTLHTAPPKALASGDGAGCNYASTLKDITCWLAGSKVQLKNKTHASV